MHFLRPIPVKVTALRSHTLSCPPDSCLCLYNGCLKRKVLSFFKALFLLNHVSVCVFYGVILALSRFKNNHSQAFIWLTYKHFYCSNVILWAKIRRKTKRHAFFDFLPINVWNCNNLWGTDNPLLSHVARGTGLLSLSLPLCGMRVQRLVTLWGLGLFNEVVICLHRGSPLNLRFSMSSDSV